MRNATTASLPRLRPLNEGAPDGGDTLFFIQGWPDDHTLWDRQVERLRDHYRCVRIDLPNHGAPATRRWGYSHDEMIEGLADCIREVSPDAPVTLILHDWGAYWGYRLHHRYPELVERVVGLDLGAFMLPTPREMLMIAGYQWWLLAAFVVGGPVGDRMTRWMAQKAGTSPRAGPKPLRSRIPVTAASGVGSPGTDPAPAAC